MGARVTVDVFLSLAVLFPGVVAVAAGVRATIVLMSGTASRLLADPHRDRLAWSICS